MILYVILPIFILIFTNIFLYIQLRKSEHSSECLKKDNNELLNLKGLSEGRYEHAKSELGKLYDEKSNLLDQIGILNNKIIEFEKQKERLSQQTEHLQNEKNEWEKTKEAILAKLSEELMRKNHEQQLKITASSQENIAKVTENLFKNFETVMTKVKNLDDEVKKSSDMAMQTRNALLTPGHAGRTAEITLENILKYSGLKEKTALDAVGDYILQSHLSNAVDQEFKRPDAILFLPNNYIIIIDSKSSSHFLDLFECRQNGKIDVEKTILAKLKESMRRHVEGLKKRDYARFFNDEMRLNNFTEYKIMNIMFLQTEQMLEIVGEIDEHFLQKTMESGIHIATPISLIHLLNNAKFLVDRIKQQENIAELKIEVSKLIDNIFFVAKESKEVGKSLNKGLAAYNKMSLRFNKGIFSAVKNINELGISSKKSDELQLLENYDIEDNFSQ